MAHAIDITGQRFGRLVVLERVPGGRHARWLCQCDCGNTTIAVGKELRTGNTKSCGCLVKEHAASMAKGHTDARHTTHGLSRTPEYSIWCDIKRRCYNPQNKAYKYYGGRGITMCDRWRESFEAFYEDMKPRPSARHSIERKDNDGPYSPENCEWIETRLQTRNTSRNVYITYDGRSQTVYEWARELGIKPLTLYSRLDRGWTVEEALGTPLLKRRGPTS